jgi:hypothetical protein
MEDTLVTLKELQSVDSRLAKLREEVASLSLRVDGHRKRVGDLKAELEAKARELKGHEKDSAKRELDVKVIQDKIAKLRDQLNTLSSNKQYQAVMKEIGGQEAESTRAEEAVLEIMEKADQSHAAMDQIREQIGAAEAEVAREEAVVAVDVQGLSGSIRELMAERQALVHRLDRLVADKYEKIARGKNGLAVVPVINSTCQGCHMGVTKQMILRLWSKKELLYCPNCARIVYLEGEVT